ncbi:Cu(I)-responsive transcriptional regulator [uncultured Gilvimarinus sp.]|uniref:Cu(I)-responsive transcriptional regulator n=1 Tax=uncultured Gilvimarinus sp. TaxID=1689143 RepID=UPI0030D83F2E
MNIGQAAEATGLSTKSIRYYESQGLLQAQRQANGYRHYDRACIRRLTLLSRARSVGFSLQECAELLALFDDQKRHSKDVKRAVQHKIAQLDKQLDNLTRMRNTLEELAHRCTGDEKPQCAILSDLSESERPMTFTLLEDSHE